MAVACSPHHTLAVTQEGHALGSAGDITSMLGMTHLASRFRARLVMVSCGREHEAYLDCRGELWTSGHGDRGQLGNGALEGRVKPTRLQRCRFGGVRVKMVACGGWHTLAVTDLDIVWAFGAGCFGQLGTGDEFDRTEPAEVVSLRCARIVFVAAGCAHSTAVSAEGRLFTWGDGSCGKLGHGNRDKQLLPRKVASGCFGHCSVVQTAAGANHTAAVTVEGLLYTFGLNCSGQLGQGDETTRLLPTLVPASACGGPVLMVACGAGHTLAVTQRGSVMATGEGYHAQLGLGDLQRRVAFERVPMPQLDGAKIATVSAGYSHSAAVSEDGALLTWGRSRAHGNPTGRAPATEGMGVRHRGAWESDRPYPVGHDDVLHTLQPTLVDLGNMGTRIGRCRALPREHALAFAMVTHPRLGRAQTVMAGKPAGEQSVFAALVEHLVEMVVVGACREWPEGAAGQEEGVVRLLGGGLMLGSATRPLELPADSPHFEEVCEDSSRDEEAEW